MHVFKTHDAGFGNLLIHLSDCWDACQTIHSNVYNRFELSNCVSFDGYTITDEDGTHPNSKIIINPMTRTHIHSRISKFVRPTPHMKKLIDKHKHLLDGVQVGVHIRRGSYSNDSHQFKNMQFYHCSDQGLENFMGLIESARGKVYVASDSKQVKTSLKERFGDKISTLDTEFAITAPQDATSTQNAENLQNAYLEWFLLSMCPVLYITGGEPDMSGFSTFSYTAAVYGKVPFFPVMNTPLERTLVYYAGNMGFCANLNNIIRMIEYSKRNNMKMKICYDYSMHGNYDKYIDLGIETISGIPEGYRTPLDPLNVFVHPDWDHPNPTLEMFETIQKMDMTLEQKRAIAKTFVPKMNTVPPFDFEYDALHIRRGDAMTSGEGCKYFHASEYLKHTPQEHVFVMSDDYNVLSECNGKIIHHIIPENSVGNWSTPNYVTEPEKQPVFMFQSNQTKYEITHRLVTEMYICAKSKTFVHTNSSVSEFIKCIHDSPERCINLQSLVQDEHEASNQ